MRRPLEEAVRIATERRCTVVMTDDGLIVDPSREELWHMIEASRPDGLLCVEPHGGSASLTFIQRDARDFEP